MPRVLKRNPTWLSRPAPGFDMFTPPLDSRQSSPQTEKLACIGPRRTIAKRGTEIFVAVGNTIRWADLPTLKDDFSSAEDLNSTPSKIRGKSQSQEDSPPEGNGYRTLRVEGVHEPIQQLITSPGEDLMAIVTAHTIRIAILPDSIHLTQKDIGPIKVKTSTLGPTIHVVKQARIVDALWHPLGASGHCLVTVTADAVVRLWELKKDNRWSYDRPTIDIDLAKLHYAESLEDNVGPAGITDSKAFSLDTLGMQVASATFGGTGSQIEQGWSSMTLWLAMTDGDIYALCPLLPSKWRSPSTQIPSLTTAVVAKKAYAEGPESHEELQRNFEAQYKWLTDLDAQDPIVDGVDGSSIYTRPKAVGSLPRLQGPFRILPGDLEDDLELANLHVIAPKLSIDDLVGADEDDQYDELTLGGLSATVVCLMTTAGRLYVCLNLEEVEGQWLPASKPRAKQLRDPDAQPELILLEGLDTLGSDDVYLSEAPVITQDIESRYAFFVNHSEAIYYFSLDCCIKDIEAELQYESTSGISFRMGIFSGNGEKGVFRESIMRFDKGSAADHTPKTTAPVLFNDSDLGYFLLTCFDNLPKSAILDQAEDEPPGEYDDTDNTADYEKEIMVFKEVSEGRKDPVEPFEPPAIFWSHRTALPTFLDTHVNKRHRSTLKEEIRLSSATLEVMTEAHRVLSQETHNIADSVSLLFRRCDRLRKELQEQVSKVRETSALIDKITGDDSEYSERDTARGSARLKARLDAAQQKQAKFLDRYEVLKKKATSASSRPLSESESKWIAQVDKMRASVMPEVKNSKEGREKKHWQRAEEARELGDGLVAEARDIAAQVNAAGEDRLGAGFRVPPDIRKSKMKQVMDLLERESALVDAVEERLQRLSIVGAS